MSDQNFIRNDKPNPFLIDKLIEDIMRGDYTDYERRDIFKKTLNEVNMAREKLETVLKHADKNEIVS